jgi:DNA polymerase I
MKRLGIDYRKMSPLGSVKDGDGYRPLYIKGIITLDMYEGYKKFRSISNQGRMESYSLEYVAQEVLGKGKIPHEEVFHQMWLETPIELIKYNMRDAELVIELDKQLGIIEFYNYLRATSYAQMSQVQHVTSLIDGYLLSKVKGKYVLPSKSPRKEGEKYSGAYVFKPTPAIYNNVLALDVKSLYPNIIRTFNIGYETYNPKGEIKIKEGLAFDRGKGIISQSMEELAKERAYYKKLAKTSKDKWERKANNYKQYAVKVLMNSFYGYLGYPGSRMYKKEIAESITYIGQQILFWNKKVLDKLEYEIIYGDTDSVYVQAKETTLLALIKEGRKLFKLLNESYKEFAKQYGSDCCTLEIEFEKIFKKILFVGKRGDDSGAKKKYAYIPLWMDGEISKGNIKFVGFSSVRSDTPRLAKKVEVEVIGMILKGEPKEKIISLLKEIDKKIRNGEIPIEEIAFPKGISKSIHEYGKEVLNEETGKTRKVGTPPVVQGAKYSNKYLGTRFRKGSKPKWTYIKKTPQGYPPTNVISFNEELPDGFVPDYDIIIDRLFKMKLESSFISAGFGPFPNIDSTKKELSEFI